MDSKIKGRRDSRSPAESRSFSWEIICAAGETLLHRPWCCATVDAPAYRGLELQRFQRRYFLSVAWRAGIRRRCCGPPVAASAHPGHLLCKDYEASTGDTNPSGFTATIAVSSRLTTSSASSRIRNAAPPLEGVVPTTARSARCAASPTSST